MSPQIRAATAHDAEALVMLYEQLGTGAPCRHEVVDFFETMKAYPSYSIFLTTDHRAQPLGTYTLVILDNLAHASCGIAVVENVVVANEARRRGIGKAMMEDGRQRAAAAGCYKLMLSSNRHRDEAQAFYEGLGFEQHGYSWVVGA